jgi:hypothetical protein
MTLIILMKIFATLFVIGGIAGMATASNPFWCNRVFFPMMLIGGIGFILMMIWSFHI